MVTPRPRHGRGGRWTRTGAGLPDKGLRTLKKIMIWMLLLAGPAVWMLCFPVPSPAEDQEAILAAIQRRYAGITGLMAEYTRVTTTPAMESLFQTSAKHTASGTLIFKKPAKLILDQTRPRPEKMITDGATVWWYIPEENLVHRYSNMDVSGELKPLLDFLGGLDSLTGRFEVRVTPAGTDGQTRHRLQLNRLQEGAGLSGITVWFEPGQMTLKAFRLTSLTGETTDFSLRHVRTDTVPDDRAFVFQPPAGVEIIEESGY